MTKSRYAERLAAATELLGALEFYADPETYFAVTAIGDAPNGEFLSDAAPLTDDQKQHWDDYRAGGDYYGKRAREALVVWLKANELEE